MVICLSVLKDMALAYSNIISQHLPVETKTMKESTRIAVRGNILALARVNYDETL
jgi:hypothetical protein